MSLASTYLADKDVNEIVEAAKQNSRIKWSIPAKNEGISFEFDRTPILSAGTVRFHCHQGADIDLVQKNKRKRKKDEMQVGKSIHIKYI